MTDPTTLRDEGQALATNHADSRIVAMIDAAIERQIATRRPFTVADVRADLPTVSSTGLVGARFRAATMRKPARMRPTGRFVPSDLPSTRAAVVREWVGI